MKSYKVYLREIKLFGYHGVLREEKEKGQNFFIDIKYSYKRDEVKDNINSAIDYSEVYLKVKEVFEAKEYEILEVLCQDIAKSLIDSFLRIKKVKVRITKIKPLIGGEVGAVSVSAKEEK